MNKEHLSMFALAEKVQEGWTPKEGDWYACGPKDIPTEECYLVQLIKDNYSLNRCTERKSDEFTQFYFHPSMEQMAEMWSEGTSEKHEAKLTGYDFFESCYYWSEADFPDKDWPLPIIVLHFILSDLYNMKWEDGKWVSNV